MPRRNASVPPQPLGRTMNAPVQNTPIYQALAEAFAAEGVDTQFTLMGDGNMHWSTAMNRQVRRGHGKM